MGNPDFQTLMRPLLELHSDGAEKTQDELRDALARQFELTEDDLAERLPSGTARTFVNRVAWTSTHMKEAGLLVKPRRGISKITERGLTVLNDYPERVDMSVLEQFPEYVEFRTRSSGRRRVTQPQVQEPAPRLDSDSRRDDRRRLPSGPDCSRRGAPQPARRARRPLLRGGGPRRSRCARLRRLEA